eukprot:gene12704-biopygen15524
MAGRAPPRDRAGDSGAGRGSLWSVGGQAARRVVGGSVSTFPHERSKVPRDFRLSHRDANRRARARSGRANDADGCGE